ncbi:MAG: protease modulator HflC [Planctomycetota bacterium]|nr:MAG: protease modulator HflC [Planctomycetota bacterium]
MTNAFKVAAGLIVAVVGTLLLSTAVVFVDETEHVIVERLGRIAAVYDRPESRGLHWKWPWPIGTVRRFDRRIQLFDPPAREIFTRDRKNITVDAYVCWQIPDGPPTEVPIDARPVVRFFRSVGLPEVAHTRMDSRLRSVLATEFGRIELSDLLTVHDPEAGPDPQQPSVLESLTRQVREQLRRRPDEADAFTDRLGIAVVDVQIKRINFPLGNQAAVFERMRSERRKIADRYRSAGMAENAKIRSLADRQYEEIIANATADSERIRGEAEAEALALLNDAHAKDPTFYRFLRTLDAYRRIFNDRTTIVLSASSELMKLLTDGVPQVSTPAKTPDTPPKTTAHPLQPPSPAPSTAAADRIGPQPTASTPATTRAAPRRPDSDGSRRRPPGNSRGAE